jgi:hypothetical protein
MLGTAQIRILFSSNMRRQSASAPNFLSLRHLGQRFDLRLRNTLLCEGLELRHLL